MKTAAIWLIQLILFVLVLMALAGCQTTDVWCRTHSAADLKISEPLYRAMTPADKRAALRRIDEAVRLCNFNP